MSLWGALIEHEGALRAALEHEYHFRLIRNGNGRVEPYRSLLEVADYVVNLPPGSALHRAHGGHAAMSGEQALIHELQYTIAVLDWHTNNPKGRAPDRMDYPEPIRPPKPSKRTAAEKNKANAWADRDARRRAAAEAP